MWDFLLYFIPWYVQLGIVVAFVALLFLVAVKIFGWERVRPFVLPVIAVVGALATLSRARQQGWEDKVKKDLKAADKLIDRATKRRAEAEAELKKHPEKLRDSDGFRRD